MIEFEELEKDDWDLTLKEWKSQRVQAIIQLSTINAVIAHLSNVLKNYPKEKVEKELGSPV